MPHEISQFGGLWSATTLISLSIMDTVMRLSWLMEGLPQEYLNIARNGYLGTRNLHFKTLMVKAISISIPATPLLARFTNYIWNDISQPSKSLFRTTQDCWSHAW